jgi:hypothetical protein
MPLDVSLGNLCTHAATPPKLEREIRERAEVMIAQLKAHPDWLVTYVYYSEEEPQGVEREITVRKLAEEQLADLRSGEEAERELGGTCAPDLQQDIEEALD